MTTISDAKSAVWNYLLDMGMSPSDVKITSFDSEKKDEYWELEGDFQNGFMGNPYKFSANFNPSTKTVSKMKVHEIK